MSGNYDDELGEDMFKIVRHTSRQRRKLQERLRVRQVVVEGIITNKIKTRAKTLVMTRTRTTADEIGHSMVQLNTAA